MRNARRLDILHRALVEANGRSVGLYLLAAESLMGTQREARVAIRAPGTTKMGVVEVYQGHHQELRRALALRRTRKITPMPLP